MPYLVSSPQKVDMLYFTLCCPLKYFVWHVWIARQKYYSNRTQNQAKTRLKTELSIIFVLLDINKQYRKQRQQKQPIKEP